jgi:hypothetical protein
MRKLSDRLHDLVDKGKEVHCPHKGCPGIVIKVSGENFEQYSEIYWEKTNYYRCNRNCTHVWKYFTDTLDHFKKIKP